MVKRTVNRGIPIQDVQIDAFSLVLPSFKKIGEGFLLLLLLVPALATIAVEKKLMTGLQTQVPFFE